MDRERGLFIVLEGIDNCGKTTQSELLASSLEKGGHQVVLSREPGGTKDGERIREILLNRDRMLDPVTQTLLFYAARNEYLQQVVLPNVKRGVAVISDRFEPSTYAYQVYAQGVNIDLFNFLRQNIVGYCYPDLCIILDISAEESKKRALNTDNQAQQLIYEKQGLQFMERLRNGYLSYLDNYRGQDVYAVDGMQSKKEVHRDIVDLVNMKISRFKACGLYLAKNNIEVS